MAASLVRRAPAAARRGAPPPVDNRRVHRS